MKGNYKTVLVEGQFEIEIQKSRFIGHVCPVNSEDEAVLFIEKIRKTHWSATHNVPVYLIGEDYKVQRYSDDGEPSGTAGIPVMEMLKKEQITNICIVITRYFGGIKLGTGGLVRAYTECAKSVIDYVGLIEKRLFHETTFTLDYTLHGKIQNYCMNDENIIIANTDFTDKVHMKVWIEPSEYNKICAQIIDLSSNQIQIDDPKMTFLTFQGQKRIEA